MLLATPKPPATISDPVVVFDESVVFEATSVVNDPVLAVVDPMAPGLAKVAPLSELAFRLGMLVVDAITSGAVPVATLEVITPLTPTLVKDPVLAVVDPMAPGLAKVAPLSELAFRLGMLVDDAITSGAVPVATLDVITPLTPIVVNDPVLEVVDPMAPGLAKVDPFSKLALRFAMLVVDAITSAAVPVATLEVIAPLTPIVVKDPVLAVVDPMAPGLANVAPFSRLALRFAMLVVDAITSAAVPVATLEVIAPLTPIVVNDPVLAVDDPIAPGLANVAPFSKLALRFAMLVDDAITSGAVPVATLEVITPLTPTLVNDPVLAVVDPMAPGLARFTELLKAQLAADTPVVRIHVKTVSVPDKSVVIVFDPLD